jgi:hypothetical protein
MTAHLRWLRGQFVIEYVDLTAEIDLFECVVRLIVIDSVKSGLDQFLLTLNWIAAADKRICFCQEVRRSAPPSITDQKGPSLLGNIWAKSQRKPSTPSACQ